VTLPARPVRSTQRAPAKINLGLRIVGRRADGYHAIESLFLPLDLADELELELSPARESAVEIAVESEGAPGGVPADASNLAARAALGFLEAAGLAARVRLRLRKRVPAAAGLGGGSSDAAATLRALDALVPGALPRERLAAVALDLGADVPFFLNPRPAWVSGVGERVEPAAGVPPLDLVLANPGAALSTAEVYAGWDAGPARASRPGDARRGLEAWLGGGGPALLAGAATNDLEGPARQLCPAIGPLREALERSGAETAALSGSGATVYGVFRDAGAARAAAERLAAGRGAPGSAAFSGGCPGGAAWIRVARTAGSR
jgi:4-diphosphocytidyl-2-C-methyl-D-erythritol kinase